MAYRIPIVDEYGMLPADIEIRLAAPFLTKADLVGGTVPTAQLPTDAMVNDVTVAAQINGTATGAAIDARIAAEVAPVVEQLTADYLASDELVVDAAAAAVNANPKVSELEGKTAGLTQDMIVNGSFRDGFTGWGNVGAWAVEGNGVTSWARAMGGADGSLTQSIVVPVHLRGQTLRLYARGTTTSAGVLFTRVTTVTGNTEQQHALTGGAYQLKTLDVLIPAGQGATPITVSVGRYSGNVYMTAIRLEDL